MARQASRRPRKLSQPIKYSDLAGLEAEAEEALKDYSPLTGDIAALGRTDDDQGQQSA